MISLAICPSIYLSSNEYQWFVVLKLKSQLAASLAGCEITEPPPNDQAASEGHKARPIKWADRRNYYYYYHHQRASQPASLMHLCEQQTFCWSGYPAHPCPFVYLSRPTICRGRRRSISAQAPISNNFYHRRNLFKKARAAGKMLADSLAGV